MVMQQHVQERRLPRFDEIFMAPFSSAVMAQVAWVSHKHLAEADTLVIHHLAISSLTEILGMLKQLVTYHIYHPNMPKTLSQVHGDASTYIALVQVLLYM